MRGGVPANAVYGFCSMFLKVINDLKPRYLAVAFDTPQPTFRHQEFVGYQAQRPKIEEELAGQIDKVKEVLGEMGVAVFEKPGFEADDVIGTIAALAAKNQKPKTLPCRQAGKNQKYKLRFKNIQTIIVSGDRDLMQLVDKNTKLYLPVKGLSEVELVDEKGVEEKLGIKPKQVVDYKGLVGDPSDNYPGVPGVGPKTATQLLAKYRTLEGIYGKIKDKKDKKDKKIREKLLAGKESAVLSKKLAKIATNVPLKIDWEKLKMERVKREKIVEVLARLGFKSLVRRVEERGVEKVKKVEREKEIRERQLGLFS